MSQVLTFNNSAAQILMKITWQRHDIHEYQDYIKYMLDGNGTHSPVWQVRFYDDEVFTMAKIIRYSTENS